MAFPSILTAPAFWASVGEGIVVTVALTVLSMILGLAIAIPLAVADLRASRPISLLAKTYVFIFRGIPLLILLFLFYYGLPRITWLRGTFFWDLVLVSPFRTAVFVLSVNNAAYLSETVRGGLLGVGRGLVEAGRAVGMTERQIFLRIEGPLAYRAILGNLGNETVAVMKASAVTSVITIHDLMGGPAIMGKVYLDVFTPLVVVGAIYLILVALVDLAVARLRVRAGLSTAPTR